MMKRIKLLATCCAIGIMAPVLAVPVQVVQAATQEIAAVVNDEAISVQDLNKRMKLIMVSSGLPNNKEIRERLSDQILGSLISERLMMQEARKYNLSVSKEEIDQGLATVAQQNKMSADKFRSMISRSGIDISTMFAQIEAQVAWSKVVQKLLRQRVVVSERDIDDVLERIKAKAGSTEFLAAEIYLPTSDGKGAQKAQQLANRLVREIKSGKASFFKLAQQFSQSAGSVNGGDIGWVNEGQVAEEILAALQSVKKNQVTQPIKMHDGYRILFLRDTRVLSEDTIPSRDQIYYNLGAERLDKLQRRYLMDLRASAFVDVRV